MRSIKDIFRSYAVFDADGRHTNGTDKESNHHYGDAYEGILTYEQKLTYDTPKKRDYPYSIRGDVKLMMEIGIAGGASLLAWKEVFPSAHVVGMDIMTDASGLVTAAGCEFRYGDQRSKEDCERAAAGRQFDLIVEDATHVLSNTLLTLLFMWPFVKPGGMYIVEEWDGIGGTYANVQSLWPQAEVVETRGPSGGVEPLVVFRKPTGATWK